MVNPELVRQLLKELEAEKRSPVQIRADTPASERYAEGSLIEGREYFGEFSKREVMVKRVDNLDDKYRFDVELIEGRYADLSDLFKRMQGFNALYASPVPHSLAKKAYELVREKTGVNNLIVNSLASNFKENFCGRISAEEVYNILDREGIVYLKHNLDARPDGVYDDKIEYVSQSIIDETKVADITLKLME